MGQVRDSIVRTTTIIHLLSIGRKLTTMEIAEMTGLTRKGAWRMMTIASASDRVSLTCIDGYWQITNVALGATKA